MCGFRKNLVICLVSLVLLAVAVETSAVSFQMADYGQENALVSVAGCRKKQEPVLLFNSYYYIDGWPDAEGFCNSLRSYRGWDATSSRCTGRKHDNVRWEQYASASVSGGQEEWNIDASDFHYHVGFGYKDQYGITVLSFGGSNKIGEEYKRPLYPEEACLAWGDRQLEWIGFRCSELLDDASWRYWACTMDGLNLMLGFKTQMEMSSYCIRPNFNNQFGRKWAEEMKLEWTHIAWPAKTEFGLEKFPKELRRPRSRAITQAFFTVVDQTQGAGTVARVIAETPECYGDYLHRSGGHCRNTVSDEYKWLWDHVAGSWAQPQGPVGPLSNMCLYRPRVRDVNETYIRNIGSAFGFSDEPILDLCWTAGVYEMYRPDDPCDANSNYHVLEVSKTTGHYYYHDLGRLWNIDPCDLNTPLYDPNNAPTRAYNFLTSNNLYPMDVDSNSVAIDYLIKENINDPCEPNEVYPQNCSVVFTRKLYASAGQYIPVVGPGARIKVYIGGDGNVIGCMGNWREVQPVNTIPVMTKQEAWDLFQQYGQSILVTPITLDYNEIQTDPNTAFQAYYECSPLDTQTRLIPLWMFDGWLFKDGNSVGKSLVHIPAAKSFCPPVARITSPENGAEFNYGDNIQFRCSLADANFGTAPYTYEWESDIDGFLTNQQDFDANSLSVGCGGERGNECEVAPHTVTLTVTDAEGLRFVQMVNITVQGTCYNCHKQTDLNWDGFIDFSDFAILADNWLTESYKEGP